MRILGIDPGFAIVGYGVIDSEKGKSSVVDYGVITTPKGEKLPARLHMIYDDLAALIGRRKAQFVPAAEEETFDPKAVIEKYVQGEEESGFNLDDVLNPKGKLDLEKLCRNLGLMDD